MITVKIMLDFSIDLLRTFLAVHKYKSITVAAEQLYKTQTGVSAQIALLEEKAKIKLLDRSRRPYQLTEAGHYFLDFAEMMVNRTDGLDSTLKELTNGNAGEIKIGASTSIATYVLPPIVISILKEHPNLNFTVMTQPPRVIAEAVRQCELDFAVVLTHEAPQGLKAKVLRVERLCFITSSSHSLRQPKLVAPKDIRHIPFVMGLKNSEYARMINGMLRAVGVHETSVVFRINSFEAMKEFVRSGMGVTIVPEFAVKHEIEAHVFSEVKIKNAKPTFKIMLIERPRVHSSPSVKLAKHIIEQRIVKVDQ
jgi:LysR family transcriptional regulator, transcriptional activator of the cysJI operon